VLSKEFEKLPKRAVYKIRFNFMCEVP